ncbi:Transcriptional regulator, XRE family [Desulfosporosinus sp. I2]|uniref:Transcriptional regulator, XRE family n=3 Tax=Desulfosporosinus TaxID=79206 RepID=A0A1Q8QNS3_9FIRM|nr:MULTISPECIES: helix-turn-helix transcriptional regulator [Desulfosporosinus]EGW36644.1 helix-turn-helix family protein [Desulfosporosinus sp. OT]KJR47470.1 Transcriptional regulator, XRE family [Desulfosporosinus sp. I2]MCO5385309.1 helix-turn-helix domain-containing protein [Desulfosporosinus sp.]OLN28985.1 Transcriptional regulator, XRE family [Desulfosporosinus metallidurans]
MYEDLFYERLTRLRTQKGVSARDMSLSLGQSESYINKIENKKSLPSMTGFFYICEYLNVPPKDFFDDEVSFPTKLNDLIDELKKLNDGQLEHLLAIIKDLKTK